MGPGKEGEDGGEREWNVKCFIKLRSESKKRASRALEAVKGDLTKRPMNVIINNCISVAKMPKTPRPSGVSDLICPMAASIVLCFGQKIKRNLSENLRHLTK